MVALRLKQPQEVESLLEQKDSRLLPTPFTYGAVPVSRIISNDCRLDASSYNMDAMNALSTVSHCVYGAAPMKHLLKIAFVGNRFKRIYTDNPSDIPFFLPSDIEDVYPKATKFISSKTKADIDFLRVEKDMLLMTCSGTIGKLSLVGTKLEHQVFSHDLLRITFKNDFDLGYIYAFFHTETGLTILQSNNYGAVIDHIEPEHLCNIPIPNAPKETRKRIHDLITASYDLRDQSNSKIDEAERILYAELHLPKLSEVKYRQYQKAAGFNNFVVKASCLDRRIDASYHLPVIKEALKILPTNAKNILNLGDKRLSKDIVLPGRFKRVYVEKEFGVPFVGGRQLTSLSLDDAKYLSKGLLTDKFKYSSMIQTNDILVSARGTIGVCQLTPLHWNGSLISDNIIKIIHADESNIGYIYCFLQSEIGKALMHREISGSVVDVLEPTDLFNYPIPILKSEKAQSEINDLVLNANDLRYHAYQKEQEAISMMNDILNNCQNKV